MVMGAVLLPILMIALLSVAYSMKLLHAWKDNQHICRTGALDIQESVVTATNQILALNPFVKALHAEYRLAKAAAKTPQGAAWLASVVIRQKLLAAKQTLLQKTGEARASLQAFRLGTQLKVPMRPIRLHLLRKPSTQFVSEMEASPSFDRLQTFRLRWQSDSEAPKVLRLNTLLKGECASSPELEVTKWKARIGEARPSLNR